MEMRRIMSNSGEKFDEDTLWLRRKLAIAGQVPTEELEDNFSKRVSVMIIDGKVDEGLARKLVFNLLTALMA